MRWYSRKATVEESLCIDLDRVVRGGESLAAPDGPRLQVATMTWKWRRGQASVTYVLRLKDGSGSLRLDYTVTRGGEKLPVDESFTIVSRRPHFGGFRYYLLCPRCGYRVVKVYLPPGATHFRCRSCHNLTYQSVQEHDKRVDWFRRNPQDAWAAVNALRAGGRFNKAAFTALMGG